MNPPNLFDYATSELSQDAFICWLLAWAAPECASLNPVLHECGKGLLLDFLGKKKIDPGTIHSVEVTKQTDNIDVLCIVNGIYAVIVEDKTGTSTHGDQLDRYINAVLSKGFPADRISPIYYKTYDQSNYDKEIKAGYSPYTRANILCRLEPYGSASPLIHDYVEHLKSLENKVNAFRTTPIDQWKSNSECWVGFFLAVRNALDDGDWGYVANPSGGFMGFWCLWSGNYYVQLEEDKLCLKFETNNAKELLDTRWDLAAKSKELGALQGVNFSKPARFGSGNWVTFAVYEGDYRVADAAGIVDVDATVERIRKAGELVKQLRSVTEPNGEPEDDRIDAEEAEAAPIP